MRGAIDIKFIPILTGLEDRTCTPTSVHYPDPTTPLGQFEIGIHEPLAAHLHGIPYSPPSTIDHDEDDDDDSDDEDLNKAVGQNLNRRIISIYHDFRQCSHRMPRPVAAKILYRCVKRNLTLVATVRRWEEDTDMFIAAIVVTNHNNTKVVAGLRDMCRGGQTKVWDTPELAMEQFDKFTSEMCERYLVEMTAQKPHHLWEMNDVLAAIQRNTGRSSLARPRWIAETKHIYGVHGLALFGIIKQSPKGGFYGGYVLVDRSDTVLIYTRAVGIVDARDNKGYIYEQIFDSVPPFELIKQMLRKLHNRGIKPIMDPGAPAYLMEPMKEESDDDEGYVPLPKGKTLTVNIVNRTDSNGAPPAEAEDKPAKAKSKSVAKKAAPPAATTEEDDI